MSPEPIQRRADIACADASVKALPDIEQARDFPVPGRADWKNHSPDIEAEAQETDKALRAVLMKLGI